MLDLVTSQNWQIIECYQGNNNGDKCTCVNLIRFFFLVHINKILNLVRKGDFGYTLTLNSGAFDWFHDKI